jgi:hypothetical protein
MTSEAKLRKPMILMQIPKRPAHLRLTQRLGETFAGGFYPLALCETRYVVSERMPGSVISELNRLLDERAGDL